ncbi:MAG TPA: PEGA domain-containing protein [Polyangiaceae bacterium]|nr:PEGA domain-containing protein [Polyangiaceae bacterium]
MRGFRDAWELSKTPEIAANLAVVEASFGHHRDASEHFQFALAHLPPTATVEQKQAVVAGLDEEKRYVVTLVIQGAPAGARISIDGTLAGVAPGLHDAYVDPGIHTVRAEAPGYQSMTRSVQASAGTTVDVPLVLQVEGGAQSSTSPAPGATASTAAEPARLDDQTGPSLAPILIGAGVTVVGATIGTVFLLKMNSAKTEASNLSGSLPAGDAACGGMTPYASQCEALENANADGNRYRTISAVSFAVAGAAAVGSAVYWLWPRADHTGAVPRASATFAPGYASAEARWSW